MEHLIFARKKPWTFKQEYGSSISTLGTEGLERPRKRRRRNSDSNVYCKTGDDEIGESKTEPEMPLEEEAKYLDSEKYAFVQNYLQNIHETHSMTTETSDSGIRTLGEPSNTEMQDITYNSRELCLKDLSQEIASQLRRRLVYDQVAMRHVCQSFGITWTRDNRRMDIFRLFPDTPVKLLKDVFEALQLYDLVDLLKEEKPQTISHGDRSLRIALPLQEVEKLKKGADRRPTTYHSSAAVLIIADIEDNNSYSEGIRDFFKGLNAKSDITIIEFHHVYDKQEIESAKSAASAVIERWIHNQGNFSLFAVFLPTWRRSTWMAGIILRLVSGIPDKIKLVIGPFLRMERKLPETLLLASSLFLDNIPLSLLVASQGRIILRLILEILNKRWRKLDLISMVEELNRSLQNQEFFRINNEQFKLTVDDNLTSLPRFKKEEDITD